MKARITRGSGFLGALLYVLDEGPKATGKKRPELIATNMPGRAARTFAAAFGAYRRLRPDIARPVWHSSLRLPPGDRIDSELWREIVLVYLRKMGFEESTPYVVERHNDEPDGDHVHCILSRINSRGEVWFGQHEVRRAIQATQELEVEFGLRLTPGLGDANAEAKTKRPDRNADHQSIINANRVRGQPRIDSADIAGLLLGCAQRSHDLPTFTAAAAEIGITVMPNRSATTGYVSGLSVVPMGRKKPVPLGDATRKKLTWPKLLKGWAQNDAAADAAQRAARNVVAAAERRAADQAQARLLSHGGHGGVVPSKSGPMAILPSLTTKEAQAMARHLVDPNDQLGFLSEPPPPRPAGRLDDAALNEGEATRRKRERRERDNAEMALAAELKSASKKQLELARRALTSELRAADAEAIASFVIRLSRLVIRLLTLGQVVLPHSESERRALVARHSVERIDTELRRRADAEVVAEVDAFKESTPAPVLGKAPAVAIPKLQIVRAHDPRLPTPAPAQRDRNEMARQLDAERERNRS
jgi:hypothetical protein